MHEAIDEFLFHLKKRPHEGATAFSSRFKTQLARLEHLITQERVAAQVKRRKIQPEGKRHLGPATPVASSLEDSSEEKGEEEADKTDGGDEAEDQPPQGPRVEPEGPFDPPLTPRHSSRTPSEKPSSKGSKRQTAGTWKADQERSLLEMQRVLGTLEPSHRKPKPIFPQSVLGHLFMRKFGLGKDQRAMIIRSTGGSSRFLDVERLMRASDIDDNNRFDDKRQRVQLKPNRRDAFVAQEQDDGSSSIGDPMTDTEDEQPEVFAGEKSEESENSIEEELAEIYEIQKKAKKEFKKSFRTYKDSKKKVKEIKKSRIGPSSYFPVVAMPPDQSGGNQPSGSQQVAPKPFRPDRRDQPRGRGTGKFMKSGPKKEEAHLAQSGLITEFNYVVMEDQSFDDELFLASVPVGHAILDTGCTTSVVGQVTADTLSEFMEQCGHPKPVPVALPPVELKGFNGVTEVTTQGLRWTCKLGSLYGHITTYVIPGQTPFLLSRRVLESMGAVIDLSNHSVTSVKHGMNGVPLRQASNGHLLLPICELPEELQLNACEDENEPNTSELSVKGMASTSTLPEATAEVPEDSSCLETKGSKAVKITLCDRRKAFQTIVKNTKNAIIDLDTHRDSLTKIFGEKGKQIIYGAVAYSPKKERVPADSNRVAYEGSIATLGSDGDFCVHPWRMRPPSEDRRQVAPMKVAIFVYIAPIPSVPEDPSHLHETCEDQCFCCRSPNTDSSDELGFQDNDLSVEALYEDTDWIDASRQNPVPEVTQVRLRKNIQSIRSVTSRLVLSRIQSDRRGVRKQLKEWLGVQAPKLDKPVGLIEVFAGKGNLSRVHEEINQDGSIKLGLDHGQDFTKVQDCRILLLLKALSRPRHVWFSFPCKYWGPWSNLNMSRSDSTREEIIRQRGLARRYLSNVSEAWNLQVELGGEAHCENPLSSLAWKEVNLRNAWEVRVDQCALGLRSPRSKCPILKPTKIVTTQQSLAAGLVRCRCDGRHNHEHLEGSYKGVNMTSWAENYPRKFCRVMIDLMGQAVDTRIINKRIEEVLGEEELEEEMEDALADPAPEAEGDVSVSTQEKNKAQALVRKLHGNTGHSSKKQMMRLARRCHSSEAIVDAIQKFKCPVCDEVKYPPSWRKAAMPHAEQPNQIVGVDYVQVELKKEDHNGKVEEIVCNCLTCVDIGTGFCQQVVVQPGPNGLSKAFHQAWGRPYGIPKIIYMDPDHRNISVDFQTYLRHHDVRLLHAAAEAHHQLGQVEVANRVLRNMARRIYKTSDRSPSEVIEICCSVRNDQLRKCGFSPSQWFLGREPRHAGSLADMDQQVNPAVQSQVLGDPNFASSVLLREEAAKAFLEEHSKDIWRRAIASRSRPIRGPYVAGQLVYMFRRQGKGMLQTRRGVWIGPGRIIGTESESSGPVPRLVWVSYNGFLYRCSPEGLRPLPEDEMLFKKLSRELSEGRVSSDIERAEDQLSSKRGQFGQFVDLVPDVPEEADFELSEDVQEEPNAPDPHTEGGPRKVRRRFYRSDEYWKAKSAGMPPRGPLHEGPAPQVIGIDDLFGDLHQNTSTGVHDDREENPREEKRRRVVVSSDVEEREIPQDEEYLPTTPEEEEEPELLDTPMVEAPAVNQNLQHNSEETDVAMDNLEQPELPDEPMSGIDVPVPEDDELQVSHIFGKKHKIRSEQVLEVSLNVTANDVTDNPMFLWGVLEECFEITPKSKQRRVEVSFRKLSDDDKKLFEKAMQKEWQSWIDNKVTSLCKSRGIDPARIIRARWVLTWKKSSDPDNRDKTPKARLVLVGWQDPELGAIATDSPTLRKETKHLILSICASKLWKIWGADIKTAFLSGDPSQRQIYFKPPREIKSWMSLTDEDLFRLEKAAYGLAEAPRAWFLRLSRELAEVGMQVSQLDPCLYILRRDQELLGVCGVHVDDIIGGGTQEMDRVLDKLKKKLPFGDYRTYTIRYTGIEIRQDPNTLAIEIGQEAYIDALEPVATKPLGTASTPLKDASIMRTCAGQLAWVANSTRPDQSFLASYLQGIQDKGTVAHVQMFNKAIREMKERKVCLTFPPGIATTDWRIVSISDAGWGTRANGDSQGGYLLCLAKPDILERRRTACWIIDWQSKKLRRAVRSSVAAETLAGQNGLDGIEMFQALLAEVLDGVSPREFRNLRPKIPAALVIDSRGFYDAVTRSCCSQAISSERRLQIDYAIAKETTTNQNIVVFWVNNLRMSADALTKLKGDTKPLFEILEGKTYEITICSQSGKKEQQSRRE